MVSVLPITESHISSVTLVELNKFGEVSYFCDLQFLSKVCQVSDDVVGVSC